MFINQRLRRKSILSIIFALFILLNFMFSYIAYAQGTTANKIVQLQSDWAYAWGDVSPHATKGIKWNPVSSLNNVNAPVETSVAPLITFKTKLPQVSCSTCVIFINHYVRAYDLYLGNERIYRSNVGNQLMNLTMGKPALTVQLPAHSENQELLIVTNLYNRSFPIYDPIYFGEEKEILNQLWANDESKLMIGALILLIGIISFMLFVSLNRDYAFLFLGLCALDIGTYMICSADIVIFFSNHPVLWDYTEYILIYIMPVLAWLYFRRFVKENKLVDWLIIGSTTVFMINAIIFQFLGKPMIDWADDHRYIFMMTIVLVFWRLIKSANKDNRDARFILLSFMITCGMTLIKLVVDIFVTDSGNLIPYCGGFFMLSQLFVLTNRFRRLNEELTLRGDNLEQMNEKLRQMDQIKDSIMANTSHELRTPLHGMIGLAESLLETSEDLSTQLKNPLKMIVSSGRRLQKLIEDILDFNHIRQNKLNLNLQSIALKPAVDEVIQLTKHILANKPVNISNQISEDILNVYADENRLHQMLHHLIGNAMKFTNNGEITITAAQQNHVMIIEVKDTGIGIEPTSLERIFELFEQADTRTERVYGGTGIGLAITRNLAQMHNGSLTVSSVPGKGSIFTLSLPTSIHQDVSVRKRIDESPVHRIDPIPILKDLPAITTSNQMNDQSAMIWCVDDEPINLQVLLSHLKMAGYHVELFESGPEMLDALKKTEIFPDVLVVDVMMPLMNGYELTQIIRKQHSASELPILMLTARSQSSDILEGFESGANDYLIKPFSKPELLARLNIQVQLAKEYAQNEIKLIKKTEQVHHIMKQALQGYLLFNNELMITPEHSEQCHELLGMNPTGSSIAELITIDDPQSLNWTKQLLIGLFDLQDHLMLETYLTLIRNEIAINGRIIGLQFKPVLNSEGSVHMFMCILSDLSDQKLLEKKLRSEEQLLRMAVSVMANPDDYNQLIEEFRHFIEQQLPKLTEELVENVTPDLFVMSKIEKFKQRFETVNSYLSVPYLIHAEKAVLKHRDEDVTAWHSRIQSMQWLSPIEVEHERLEKVLPESILTDRRLGPLRSRESLFHLKQQILDRLPLKSSVALIEEVEQMYHLPFCQLFEPLDLALHAWSDRLKKSVNPLQISGGEWKTEIDSWQKFAQSFVHIIRGQLEHQIETPEERIQANKPERATFCIDIQRSISEIIIRFTNDGKGDPKLSGALRPGMFPTTQSYGLNIIQEQTEVLGGTITIKSSVELGTEFIFHFNYRS